MVHGNAERRRGIRVDALVIDEHQPLGRNSEFGRHFEIDFGFRFQRIHFRTDEDALEVLPNGREPQRVREVESRVGEQRETSAASVQPGEQLNGSGFYADPTAEVRGPQALDVRRAPARTSLGRNSQPVVSNAQAATVERIPIGPVTGPERFGLHARCREQLRAVVFARRKGDDLAIVEDNNSITDAKRHDVQTIVGTMKTEYRAWTADDAAALVAMPGEHDDKYSRGVLGVITGSTLYPGAAVLGVEAALRTGVGMVRYLGPDLPSSLVLARRPEVVTANGRVQAWLIGSGIDDTDGSESETWMTEALAQNVPVVLDGGALERYSQAVGPVVLTPHFRELARVIGGTPEGIARDPGSAAGAAAEQLGVTVVLKGHTTYVASPDGTRLSASLAPSWLATAGAGDALGGVLGALVATHSEEAIANPSMLARLAATASVIHGLAALRASNGGPLTVLDLASEVSATVAALLKA
jgi:ADP-dependent NAD(P)H-hydrate dehydratase / NAD(P)H-hydrate epimerase